MALDPVTFNQISQEHFERIQAEVKKEAGLDLSGNSGTASESGFTVRWDYNPETQDLTLQCMQKPWLVPASFVHSKIMELVAGE